MGIPCKGGISRVFCFKIQRKQSKSGARSAPEIRDVYSKYKGNIKGDEANPAREARQKDFSCILLKIQRKYKGNTANTKEIQRKHIGYTKAIQRKYIGNAKDTQREYIGIQRNYKGTTKEIHRKYKGNTTEIQRKYKGNT